MAQWKGNMGVIIDMGITLLSHVSIPLQYWEHSFATSVHVINRLPSVDLPKFQSPYLSLYHKKSMYHTLKVFGCTCFPFIQPYNKHKLEFISQESVFLGISSQHSGYKCLNKSCKIFISKDFVFMNTYFLSLHYFHMILIPPINMSLTLNQFLFHN